MRILMMWDLRGSHGLRLMLFNKALELRNLALVGLEFDGLSGWVAQPPLGNSPKRLHAVLHGYDSDWLRKSGVLLLPHKLVRLYIRKLLAQAPPNLPLFGLMQ